MVPIVTLANYPAILVGDPLAFKAAISIGPTENFPDGTFDDDARGHVFPQRHEQLPCKGDDGCLFEAQACAALSNFSTANFARSQFFAFISHDSISIL
ncbi:hypothetical protein RQ479_13540 [Mesorhizobium sp. ISC25]|uniref:hypothetical protein n=1 Tax=Mesorhizobium sp. ISC25 TaxID=3077335 RepID=UPI0035D86125